MKKLISLLLSAIMVISVSAASQAVELSALNYGDLSTCTVTIENSENVIISKDELQYLLHKVPAASDCPRFIQLLEQETNSVELTPQDLWILFLNAGDEEAIVSTREAYNNSFVQISYQNGGFFSVSSRPYESVQTYGGGDTITEFVDNCETRELGGWGSDHGWGLRVKVSASFKIYFNSPTSHGIAFTGYSRTKEAISNYYYKEDIETEDPSYSLINHYSSSASFSYRFKGTVTKMWSNTAKIEKEG